MNSRIRAYVEELFSNAPNTKKVNDLKEELIYNLTDKYNDLTASGKDPNEAFNIVVSGIGDVNELIDSVVGHDVFYLENNVKQQKKTAVVVALAVGMYILSLIWLIISEEVLNLNDGVTMGVTFLIAGLATCLLIYHFMSKPKYAKAEGTIVEEFKEWKSDKEKNRQVQRAVSSVLWTFTVAIYLVVSFIFGIWAYSWLIFIIAAAIDSVIKAIFQLRS